MALMRAPSCREPCLDPVGFGLLLSSCCPKSQSRARCPGD
jgi:hypothetical protein